MTIKRVHRQIQKQAKQRWKLENRAGDRVKPWSGLREDDYDFRSWATGASKERLQAGCLYEYARESRKLRCLLALMNSKRKRELFETTTAPGGSGEQIRLPCSFKDLDEKDAELALDGWLYCLADLADCLADTISFGELFRTKREELEKAFGGLDEFLRAKREFRYFLPVVDAVGAASQSEAERVTMAENLLDDERRIIRGESCSEIVAMRIRWRFSDSEIVAGMEKFVRAHRPRNKAYKPLQRKKGSRRDSIRAALDCLSAMRLASYYPKSAPTPTPGELAAWKSGASPNLKPSAIELFSGVRLGGRGNDIAESNFDTLINEARKAFKKSFPFGEDASNAPTLAERIMMKSERISS